MNKIDSIVNNVYTGGLYIIGASIAIGVTSLLLSASFKPKKTVVIVKVEPASCGNPTMTNILNATYEAPRIIESVQPTGTKENLLNDLMHSSQTTTGVFLKQLYKRESSFKPGAVNKYKNRYGLCQMSDKLGNRYAKMYGFKWDQNNTAKSAQEFFCAVHAHELVKLWKSLGVKKPGNLLIYLAHQQGSGGGPMIYKFLQGDVVKLSKKVRTNLISNLGGTASDKDTDLQLIQKWVKLYKKDFS